MSIFSGKCDLYDHIMGLGGWYDRDGNPVEFGSGVGAYYSDEYQDFLEFKRRTGGVIHQHMEIKVDEHNQDLVAKKCSNFEIIPHFNQVPDKRPKSGFRTDINYTYKYWGKEYTTLKELNKHGVYITIDIHFKTILDLIPYYPYIVTSCCSSNGKETVYISKESFVVFERDDCLKYGIDAKMWEGYNKELQNHYRDIILRYFDPMNREEVEFVEFDENRQAVLNNPIDENFDVEWFFEDGQKKPHWTSPIVVDADKGIIEISEEDYNNYLGKSADVYYVKKVEFGIYLG